MSAETSKNVPAAKMWIDGKDVDAASGKTIETMNPATGKVLTTMPRGAAEDVDRAVKGARRAFEAWAKVGHADRQRILWRIGELVMQHAAELARLETLDTGKPIGNATMIDVPRSADTFFYFSGWATKIHGETIPVRGPFLNYTLREPLGVVGAIIPWNFPLLLAARKIAPALAAGNAIVIKPPEQASLSTILLGRLCLEAGLPPGLVNVVTGVGEEAGAAIVDHPLVDKISFTGGTDTGRAIMRAAAKTLKKVTLELGGKSPNIVLADADFDAAIPAAVRAAFYNQGELCTAGSRLLVEASAYDRVAEGVAKGAKAMKVGDPFDAATQMGPLITSEHRARVVEFIAAGDKEGASRLAGGPRDKDDGGYYVDPTVFGAVEDRMKIACEEIFGPVLSIMRFESIEEAARLADATEFGLAAGVWTRDVGKAHRLAATIRAGTVWLNCYNVFDAASPYGGTKQSGFGRENGEEVLRDLTQVKSVVVALPPA